MYERRPSPVCVGFAALALLLGCSSQNSGTEGSGTGGDSTTGGSDGGGGTGGSSTGTGGSSTGTGGSGRGGAPATGGASGAGSGGKAGASGTSGSGGKAGASGTSGSGGKAGASGTGGASATGGATGSGGVPFKGVASSPCAVRKKLSVAWYYNWGQTVDVTDPCDSTGGQFVPMIWGHAGSEQSASGISSAVSSFVSKGYGHVLGFNEPDNSGQANISDATAVSLWPSFNNSAIQLGTPATSANSAGQTWFTSFMGSVNGSATLRADFIAVHWYGWNAGSCDAAASQLESYLKYAEGFSGNRPIWITEWGCLNDSAPDAQTVLSFYKGALAVFARHPRLQRYAWYPWSTNLELANADGSLTALGVAYAAAPSYK
jgi:putative glycosyl hydrolase